MAAPSSPEYDIIFAGGGTTACLVASRLSAASPDLKILILESGDHTKNKLEHIQPARYLSHLAPFSQTVTFHKAEKNENAGGREMIFPTGRCVGGGSSVNFMMYTRAAASDYDDWEKVYGNEGWGSKDLIPLLKKTEHYQLGEPGTLETHGYSGPLKVSMGGAVTDIGKNFLDVASKYDKDRGSTEDANGLFEVDKYGPWQKWIDAKTGTRSDVAHHFIYNQPEKKNLTIETAKRVHRVIFDGTTAVGVEYVNDLTTNPSADQTFQTAKARKMVIVSAGSFGSPAILERSGVGARDVLEPLGVEVKVDLPGVGAEYQDHNGVFTTYAARDDEVTLDGLIRGEPSEVNKWTEMWTKTGQGLLAHNGIDAGVKLRPTAQELAQMPAFSTRWKEYFQNAPDKPVLWMGPLSMHVGLPVPGLTKKCFTLGAFTCYPESTGTVHISSSTNPHAPLNFKSGFFTKKSDVEVLMWGYKKSRELARRMAAYRGAVMKPSFSSGSQADFTGSPGEEAPVDIQAKDIEYSEEDEKAVEEYVRNKVTTTWHALGTCPAKPRDQGGVVDSTLSVYGCQRLKVADLSIAPGNVGSNTYSSTLAIAEKAAIIFAKELGIEL
ncbi:GMC oxidoreductase-domain-containing protein [Flagelloscypha sp. PMI_526]|nr:GMC oxidoreductase-domain-containing protein [Flagelloscypha sp. PMI_526]